MCGITGIYSFKNLVDREEIERLTKSLSHRGPDGWDTFCDQNVALGHTRLAILDLSSAGNCPMKYTAPDGRVCYITYNGEVYNFIELRRELEQLGHRFHSNTDTEVIAAAYLQWGESAQFRFNGMWAFAIWTPQDRKLFLSRDRFSVKPLYLCVHGDRLAFASELKAFLSLSNFSMTLNEQILPRLWERHRYDNASTATCAREVINVQGGHSAEVTPDGKVQLKRWWETSSHLVNVPKTYSECVEQFRDIFIDSVKLRMRSDVPVATCLSGGIDSSAVASTMALVGSDSKNTGERFAPGWQNCFVASFPNTPLDETQYANEVLKKTGAYPHYLVFDEKEAQSKIVECVWAYDEPVGGIHTTTLLIYQLLRKHGVVVSLDGHGGDELLGGYSFYLDSKKKEVNERLYSDLHTELLPCILKNFDRAAMAHGIEIRMPLLDYRLVTFASALPVSHKMGGGYTKRILRDAMRGIMPDTIRRRRQKIGFNSPLISWLNGGLVHLVERIFTHRVWLDCPWFDAKTFGSQIIAKCKAGAWVQDDWDLAYRATTMMNFTLWRMLFVERCRNEIDGWADDIKTAAVPTTAAATTPIAGRVETQIRRSVVYSSRGPLPSQHIAALDAFARAPLGAGGEFSTDFFYDCTDDSELPIGITMNCRGTSNEFKFPGRGVQVILLDLPEIGESVATRKARLERMQSKDCIQLVQVNSVEEVSSLSTAGAIPFFKAKDGVEKVKQIFQDWKVAKIVTAETLDPRQNPNLFI